jgi:hypothetical protein
LKRVVEFQALLSHEDRRRHHHVSERGKVLDFVEQYETFWAKKWVAVIRYDTAHGFAHKDVLRPDGRAIKIRLAESDYNRAMTFAIQDLRTNWTRYKSSFLKRARKP